MTNQQPDLLILNAVKVLGLTEEEAKAMPRSALKTALFAYSYGAGLPGFMFSPSDPVPTYTLKQLVGAIKRGPNRKEDNDTTNTAGHRPRLGSPRSSH